MSNIPAGYDENGIRAGNGKWGDYFVEDEDGYVEIIDAVDCDKCKSVVEGRDSVSINGVDYCEQCAREALLNIDVI